MHNNTTSCSTTHWDACSVNVCVCREEALTDRRSTMNLRDHTTPCNDIPCTTTTQTSKASKQSIGENEKNSNTPRVLAHVSAVSLVHAMHSRPTQTHTNTPTRRSWQRRTSAQWLPTAQKASERKKKKTAVRTDVRPHTHRVATGTQVKTLRMRVHRSTRALDNRSQSPSKRLCHSVDTIRPLRSALSSSLSSSPLLHALDSPCMSPEHRAGL